MAQELAAQRVLPFENVPIRPGSGQLHRVDLYSGHNSGSLLPWMVDGKRFGHMSENDHHQASRAE